MNVTTYDGFESQKSFGGSVVSYRKEKLHSAKQHVDFIKELFPRREVTVLELGSGNSKSLYALEKAGILKQGYGIEVSKSRHQFAEQWRKQGKFQKVRNIQEDVVKTNIKSLEPIDLCLCVDLAFQFFEPVKKGVALRVLKDIHTQLNPSGKIILELDGVDQVLSRMQDNKVKLWEEFAEPDPWQYSLWDCRLDTKTNAIHWEKIYIKRNGFGRSENKMLLKVYKKQDIKKLLLQAGFAGVQFYQDWKGSALKDDKGEYIVVATKK